MAIHLSSGENKTSAYRVFKQQTRRVLALRIAEPNLLFADDLSRWNFFNYKMFGKDCPGRRLIGVIWLSSWKRRPS
jgi:hypothetical protein